MSQNKLKILLNKNKIRIFYGFLLIVPNFHIYECIYPPFFKKNYENKKIILIFSFI